MWDDEKMHLKKMNELVLKNRVRPTALLPIWNVAGFALGRDVFYVIIKTTTVITMSINKEGMRCEGITPTCESFC